MGKNPHDTATKNMLYCSVDNLLKFSSCSIDSPLQPIFSALSALASFEPKSEKPTTILAELQNDDKVIRFAKLSDEMIAPGNAYSFTTKADEGDYLSFATMFVKSNDLFFAPPQEGLALFPNGTPLEGDITAKIRLWDCGTEDTQTPGDGDQQPQGGSTTSGVPDPTPLGVRDKASFNDGQALPDVAALIRVTISVSFSAP